MEELQPHHNLKKLELHSYLGERLPRWAREDNLTAFLPNLVTLVLSFCTKLKTLECLGNLRHLKYLKLFALHNVEFIREKGNTASSSNMTAISGRSASSTSHGFSFFPSLKELDLSYMPSLKGWEDDSDEVQCLRQLQSLKITSCPSLAVILQCPLLEFLMLDGINNRLQVVTEKKMNRNEANISYLRMVYIGNVKWLKLFSIGVNRDNHVKNLEDVFHVSSYYLQILIIYNCENLTSVSSGPEHLAALKELHIQSCPNLRLYPEREEGSDMLWPSLGHSLRTLKLKDLPQLVSLPNGMDYLIALQTLVLEDCNQLESLPNWMYKLTSLRKLEISECSATLYERCRGPTGQDWPHIAHIPSIYISP